MVGGGGATITFMERVTIAALEPSRGSAAGGTVVLVRGSGFLPAPGAACRFGAAPPVPATWLSDSTLTCISPPAPAGATGRALPFALTFNGGVDWEGGSGSSGSDAGGSAGAAFSYHAPYFVSWSGPPIGHDGTLVEIHGENFPNVPGLQCRFGDAAVPAQWRSTALITCFAPPAPQNAYAFASLLDAMLDTPNPLTGYRRLFPFAPPSPLVWSHLVRLGVSANGQEFTSLGAKFLYVLPPSVTGIWPPAARDTGSSQPLWLTGTNFVNVTGALCRIGPTTVRATIVSPSLALCLTVPASPIGRGTGPLRTGASSLGLGSALRGEPPASSDPATLLAAAGDTVRQRPPSLSAPSLGVVYVELSLNGGVDWTLSRSTFEYLPPCPTGHWCPPGASSATYPAPRGTFAPGTGNTNFTLCPRGTYQPMLGASACLRCPVGYACPFLGMHVPRLCPAGFVCDVTGTEAPSQPCPEGHYCLEGTATTATTCGSPGLPPSSRLTPARGYAELVATMRANKRAAPPPLALGSRATACWDNATEDFGLQASRYPSRFWAEAHLLPLDADAPFSPRRGRYCLDSSCLRLGDEGSLSVTDPSFDYSALGFPIRRPVPCPPGVYCAPGTALGGGLPDGGGPPGNLTRPQPCAEALFCPEGSGAPIGAGDVPAGSYSPFGVRLPCPAGAYCPVPGLVDPLPCAPGTFSGQVGRDRCTPCPVGHICPGFGRIDPAICPPGYVCSREGLAHPNVLCPAGMYCPNGTATSDPFRNDTTLRPYPCRPGVYCLAGTGADHVIPNTPGFARNCTEGFYCEAGSVSATGTGPCPLGFSCPGGTAAPIPAPVGYFSAQEGTVAPATCLPGFYAPTIQTVECYPCPPGSACENDGMGAAMVCPPGTYRSITETDGVLCQGCPQGTWSKQWEVRDVGQCLICPPGVVCPVDGLIDPCTFDDLPTPWYKMADGDPATASPAACEGTVTATGATVPDMSMLNMKGAYALVGSGRRVWGRMPSFAGELNAPSSAATAPYNFYRSDTQVEGYEIDTDPDGTRYPAPAALKQHGLPFNVSTCYASSAPNGSVVYQRFKDFYGPLFEILVGRPHQGYGRDPADSPQPGYYSQGSRHIPLYGPSIYDPLNSCDGGVYKVVWNNASTQAPGNCTPGSKLVDMLPIVDGQGGSSWACCPIKPPPGAPPCPSAAAPPVDRYIRNWLRGNCEADLICAAPCPGGATTCASKRAQALPCPEGYVCGAGTTALTQADVPCPGGYVCDLGTTPDVSLIAPASQYKLLCQEKYYCLESTGPSAAYRSLCPAGFFCPTGTTNPYLGLMANDAMNRGLSAIAANPFINIIIPQKVFNYTRVPVDVSAHDQNCFLGIDAGLSLQMTHSPVPLRPWESSPRIATTGLNNTYFAMQCGRDHKWRRVSEAVSRNECNCGTQLALVLEVWMLYMCTEHISHTCTFSNWQGLTDGSSAAVNYNWTLGLALDNRNVNDDPTDINNENSTMGGLLRTSMQSNDGSLDWVLDWGLQLPNVSYYPTLPTFYFATCELLWRPNENDLPGGGSNRTWFGHAAFIDLHGVTYLNADCTTRGAFFAGAPPTIPPARVPLDTVNCPVFCSFQELKEWLEPQYALASVVTIKGKVAGDQNARVGPLIYDLKYAIDLVDTFVGYDQTSLPDDDPWHFGATLPSLFSFTESGHPLRLDVCQCESLLRCPNGTTSPPGSTSQWDCVAKGEVLRRFVPIPSDFASMSTTFSGKSVPSPTSPLLADLFNPTGDGLPLIGMRSGQSMTLTVDFSSLNDDPLAWNMTYDEDYRLAVYPAADTSPPCPPRFTCVTTMDGCYWPPTVDMQTAYGSLCGPDSSSPPIQGCCANPPIDPPYWLQTASMTRSRLNKTWVNDTLTDIYQLYPTYDNKHGMISFSITAIRDVNVLVVLELLHGTFDSIFNSLKARIDTGGLCEATMFEPVRAKYLPSAGAGDPQAVGSQNRTFYQFLAVIQQKDFTNMQLPLNLPMVRGLTPGPVTSYAFKFASTVLLDRPADTLIAQPKLWAQRAARLAGSYSQSASATQSPSPTPTSKPIALAVRALRVKGGPTPLPRTGGGLFEGSGGSESIAARFRALAARGNADEASQSYSSALVAALGGTLRAVAVALGLAATAPPPPQPLQPLTFSAEGGNGSSGSGGDPTAHTRRRLFKALRNVHDKSIVASSSFGYPHQGGHNATGTGCLSSDPAHGYEFGCWGQPLSLGDYLSQDAVAEAQRAAATIYGVSPSANYMANPYTGGALFFARSGQLVPSNPYVMPLSDPLYTQYVDVVPWQFLFPAATDEPRLQGESREDRDWRIAVGLRCVNTETNLASCKARMDKIASWWVLQANYRTRPYADVAQDPADWVTRDTAWWGNEEGLNAQSTFVALPYLPFFSNCDGYDSHLLFAKLTEANPLCSLVDAANTVTADALFFAKSPMTLTPRADICNDPSWAQPVGAPQAKNPGLPLYCTYEEDIFVRANTPRWFEMTVGSTLFWMTASPVAQGDFVGQSGDPGWGQGAVLSALTSQPPGQLGLVPVTVVSGPTAWVNGYVPKAVNLTISYYQIDPGTKRIVTATVMFGNFCTSDVTLASPSVPVCPADDFSYQLLFTWFPLGWLDLLNLFQYGPTIYALIFLALDVAILGAAAAMYAMTRATNRLAVKPTFRCWRMVAVVIPAPLTGVLLTTGAMFVVVIVLLGWWFMSASAYPPSTPAPPALTFNFEGVPGDWTVSPPLVLAQTIMYRTGRFGASLIVAGVFTIHLFTQLMTPEHSIKALAEGDNDMMGVDLADAEEEEMTEEAAAELAEAMASGSVKLGPGGVLGKQGKGGSEPGKGGQLNEDKPGFTDDEVWTPLRWKRAGLVFFSWMQTILSSVLLYFSFSPYFGSNVMVILPFFKIFIKLYEGMARSNLREVLLGIPLIVALQSIQYLVVQGAPDLLTYLESYVIVLAVTTVLRLYAWPALNRVLTKWPLYMHMLQSSFTTSASHTPQQRLADAQKLRMLSDEVAMETEGMEPVLESFLLFSSETTALLMAPFFQLLLLLLDAGGSFIIPLPNPAVAITGIPAGYGISSINLQYYTIFSVMVIFAQMGLDIFILNTMELVHGWNLYDYVSYQRYRYTLRPTRWHMASSVVDASVSSHLQSADMLCFSSQYYFLISGHAWGIIIMMLGIIICSNINYSFFADWVFAILVPAVWMLMVRNRGAAHTRTRAFFNCHSQHTYAHPPSPLQHLLRFALFNCARSGGLWMRKSLEGTMEDEVGTRLVMMEGSEGALALERIELAAMNSDRFRLRFLDRAKPWLISQLPAILTPRVMAQKGADGRAHIEYVRDVYEELIGMSENSKLEADKRSSQLTGEEAEEELKEREQLRKWKSIAPPSHKSKQVMQFWLFSARRRLELRKLVVGVRENARREKCDLCGKHESEVGHLRADMATGGRYDPYAFDNLAVAYETQQKRAGFDEKGPIDVVSWRSFFRANGTFFMRCEFCVARTAETARLVGQLKEFGREARAARLVVRNTELASLGLEEADEELTWAPVPIEVNSNAGRALKKWLYAARVRIGGVFPKPAAAEEGKKYAALSAANKERRQQKLQSQKARVLWTAPEKVGQEFVGEVRLSADAKAVAQSLLFEARKTLGTRYESSVRVALDNVETTLLQLAPSLDWHYTAEPRLVGASIVGEGRVVIEALNALAATREKGIQLDTRELASIVARADVEIARALEELEVRVSGMEVVFTSDEVKTLEKVAAKIANLEERVLELPETSSAAADTRHRIQALRNQGSALRASASEMRVQRVGVLKRGVHAQVQRLRVIVAERRVSHERRKAELRITYLEKSRLAAGAFLEKAKDWLETTAAKQATLKDAQKARGRLGLSSFLGGRGARSPASPRSPGATAASPRAPGSGAVGAATPRTPSTPSGRGTTPGR